MGIRSRFVCASSALKPKSLLDRTRGLVWLSLALAVGVHLSWTQIGGLDAEQKTAKPLTTQFVKRAPRLTKPLELKKRPRPRRRPVQRTMVSVRARRLGEGAAGPLSAAPTLSGLARPAVGLSRSISLPVAGEGLNVWAEAILGAREPQHRIDMALEMVDVDALDTGRYQAIVVQDPTEKRSIRGFFHLAMAYAKSTPVDPAYKRFFIFPRVLPHLVDAMNMYTNIRTDLTEPYTFDSRKLFETPWVLIQTANATFALDGLEAKSLGKYLASGGSAFVSGASLKDSPRSVCLRQVVKDALAAHHLRHGKDWDFQILPLDHPLFHCYFDFDEVPVGVGSRRSYLDPLEGIIIADRLIVIMDYRAMMYWWDGGPQREHAMDGTRPMQFGVNVIVFALTQEGSITQRLMESVR